MKHPKWDSTLGLDYSYYLNQPKRPGQYTPHEFPPLFKETKLIGQSDLDGRGDTFQVTKQGDYAYACHLASCGFSVVDVKDPTAPEVVKFMPTGNVHVYSTKCRVLGDILIVNNEWHFWEPPKYTIRGEDREGIDNLTDNGPKEPIETGIKIYDVSKPAEPKLLSFFKTGGWRPEGGGVGCHRFWYDGHYAYISADMPGYLGRILVIVDVSDPRKPREVSRWWMPGQWTAGGERPWWPSNANFILHTAIPGGDRLYTAWFRYGGAILDISNIKRPTLISQFSYDMGASNHTFLPIKDRQFGIFISEYRHAWMLDLRDEKYPKVVAMFPKAPKELRKRRGGDRPWGPSLHNIHENTPGPDSFRSDDIIYAACGSAGIRIYDVSDPYRIEEIAYYVPGTPKYQYDPRGPANAGVNVSEVYVDKKGLLYTAGYNHGLEILEYTG